jgi:hypothetical protein
MWDASIIKLSPELPPAQLSVEVHCMGLCRELGKQGREICARMLKHGLHDGCAHPVPSRLFQHRNLRV